MAISRRILYPGDRSGGIFSRISFPSVTMGQTVELMDRITVNPDQCGGRPCIRGLRIRVSDVLDLLAVGLTAEQVVEELPDLEREDIAACLRFVSRRLGHPVLAA
jgi:uncharacterized protein (DUF433 family)